MFLRAPVKGLVKEVHFNQGDFVTKDQVVVSLSIMKMIHPLLSPFDGVVGEVFVSTGQVVEKGDVLISVKRNT